MKRRFTFLPALLLAAASSLASPVMPGNKKLLTLADGTQVTAELFGDEFASWWQTADGKRYVPSDDNADVFVPADFEAMQRRARAMRAPLFKAQGGIGGSHITYTGKKKGLIVLVQFADTKFKEEHGHDYYEQIANQENFTSSEGYIGSVHDYYKAQSNGLFDLTFDVVGPVTLNNGYAHYGANRSSNKDTNVGQMIREATDAIANDVNFADYDWDGDGTADQVFYLYAGLGENAGGDANTIWAHMYYMRYRGGVLSYATGNVNRYACASELLGVMDRNGKYTGTTISGIGTICHEFSHCLGFPDMYDTNGQQLYGMGFYDLLANGNYLGGGLTPPNFTAWERIYAGWVEPIELDRPATVRQMVSATEYGRPFIMHSDSNPDEYYLFENRQKTGWDRKLYGSGLMITHVDYSQGRWTANNVNATGQDHQRCTIFHADNDDRNDNAPSIRGDLYPYYKKVDGVQTLANNALTDTSTPAATLWNSHDPSLGTGLMGKPVTEITQNADGTVAFLVMAGDDSNVISNTQPTGIATVGADAHSRRADAVYSLDGRRIADADDGSLQPGIYIIGGKKVVK